MKDQPQQRDAGPAIMKYIENMLFYVNPTEMYQEHLT